MIEKYINTRQIQKHGVESHWKKSLNFIPERGEWIVYDVDENYSYPRFKMGDGLTLVNDLPFLAPQPDWAQTDENALDYIKNKPEIGDSSLSYDEMVEAINAAKTELTNQDTAILTESKAYTDEKVAAIQIPDVSGQISSHNVATDSHNDIRNIIIDLTTRLNALADSDDTTLDQMSEIVAYIKSNKSLIENITTNKINVADIIDNLTTNVSNKPLSAAQGVALKSLIDGLTAADVGALPDTTVIPDALSDLSDDATHRVVTDEEKATWNAKSDFSGSFNDLTDKPFSENEDGTINHLDEKFIPDTIARVADIPEVQGQVQADWNQTDDTQIDFIKNKPTIPEEQIQADWSVNKPSDKAYVKNRPFYAKDDYVDENTIEFTKSEYGDMYIGQRSITETAEEGKEYIVIFDDVKYKCICTRVEYNVTATDAGALSGRSVNFPILGNPYLFTDGATLSSGYFTEDTLRTNDPFVLICDPSDYSVFEPFIKIDLNKIVTNSTSNHHTIQIYGSDKYVKISNDYLPDNLATHEYVQEQISSIDIPEASASLPNVTNDDNGKVLSVVDGAWAAAQFSAPASSLSWNDLTDKPFEDGKLITVDMANFTPEATTGEGEFSLLTSELTTKEDVMGSVLTGILNSGGNISAEITDDTIFYETENMLILSVDDIPMVVFAAPGTYTIPDDEGDIVLEISVKGFYTVTDILGMFSTISFEKPVKTLDAKYLPMDALKAYIDDYIGTILGGEY